VLKKDVQYSENLYYGKETEGKRVLLEMAIDDWVPPRE
jgi:hypothetical protein